MQVENQSEIWSQAAQEYSDFIHTEWGTSKEEEWRKIIQSNIPQGKTLRVLDVGCGPGFFAIMFTQLGHKATGVDFAQGMLDTAKKNAAHFKVQVEFQQMDATDLKFPDNSFDVVISRNITWTLLDPAKAYKEWYRVLDHGGVLLNFDGNYFYHVVNEEFKIGYQEDRRKCKENNIPDKWEEEEKSLPDEEAKKLPLTHHFRPTWDVDTLFKLGVQKMTVNQNIGHLIYTPNERIMFGSTPMIMIKAEKL